MVEHAAWLEAVALVASESDALLIEEAAEVRVAEAAGTRLVDREGGGSMRLRSGQQFPVQLLTGNDPVARYVWMVMGGEESLVRAGAIVTLVGELGVSRGAGRDQASRSLASWLRDAWEHDEVVAALMCHGDWVRGRVVQVGADHVDLWSASGTVTVMTDAVEAWRRA